MKVRDFVIFIVACLVFSISFAVLFAELATVQPNVQKILENR